MKSISTSNTILNIKNLNIRYKKSFRALNSLRELFINLIKSPTQLLKSDNSYINILENINLKLSRGDKLAIIGVNGTGKTSLCRIIAGMHGNRQEVRINGKVRAIFETSVAVQPELSGRENVWTLANLLFSDISLDEREKIIKDSIEFSELNDYIDKPFKHYSKGMKARLFLSVISSRPSDLLILDEVFSGADAFFNKKISIRINHMIKNSGAVIFVSHSEELIKSICNRAIVLNDKKVIYDGETEKALKLYKDIHHNGLFI